MSDEPTWLKNLNYSRGEPMSKPSCRELCEAIRKRDDTEAAIIGTNLAARVERVLSECEHAQGMDWYLAQKILRLLNGDEL